MVNSVCDKATEVIKRQAQDGVTVKEVKQDAIDRQKVFENNLAQREKVLA